MSMRNFSITGYGISEDELKTSIESKISFIKRFLPDEYEEMQDDMCDFGNPTPEDYEAWINERENDTGYQGFGTLFADAINDNEDEFEVCYLSQDGDGIIVYEDRLPWEMSDRVRNMKKDDMKAIFKKYLDVLGVSAEPDRQYLEMWG